MLVSWRQHVRRLKRETFALWLAYRHPDVPWYARLVVMGVVAYAVSPIDLIPDFIPVLGQLDDLVLVPLGLALALRLIPPPVMAECRRAAEEALAAGQPAPRGTIAVIVGAWVLLAVIAVALLARGVD